MISRDELHAKLDAQCDARRHELETELAKLEQDRDHGHEWIESAPEALLNVLIHPGAPNGGTVGQRLLEQFIPPAMGVRIQLYDPIKNLIRSLDPEREITTPIIYDALVQTIPELKLEDQRKLKARIAGTLSRLADEQLLKIWKVGSGSVPHTYKIVGPRFMTLGEVFSEANS